MHTYVHTYYYTYTADKDTLSFDFKDNGYSDNSGSLIFQLFNISSTIINNKENNIFLRGFMRR